MSFPLNGDALTGALNGYPIYLGTIDATTSSKTNAQATTPFNAADPALKGKVLLIQTDATVYISVVTTSTGTITTATAIKLAADERVEIRMGESRGWLAAITASSIASVKVFELR